VSSLFDCPFLSITGIPCPFCGATRASVRLLQLDPTWLDYNPVWPVVFGIAIVALAIRFVLPDSRFTQRVDASWRWISARTYRYATTVTCLVAIGWAVALINRDNIRPS